MNQIFNKKIFIIATIIVVLFEIITELWQTKTGYPFNNKPLINRLMEAPIKAFGICIIVWVFSKKKDKK